MSSLAIRRAAPANNVVANTGNAQIFGLTSNPLVPVTIGAPGKLVLEAKRFTIRAEGYLTTNGAYTAKASLVAGLSIPAVPFTIGNWTLLGAGTARAVGTTTCPWWFEANLIYDSVSGKLHGTFQQLVNNLYDASAAIANVVTGINGTNLPVTQPGPVVVQPADPIVYFGIGLTFGTADALNVGNLTNFELAF
jgi:hypothetical protein